MVRRLSWPTPWGGLLRNPSLTRELAGRGDAAIPFHLFTCEPGRGEMGKELRPNKSTVFWGTLIFAYQH